MLKNIFYLGVALIILLMAYSLGRQVYDSLGVSHRLDKEVEELLALQQKNKELKKSLAETDKITFIEQEARNRLNMAQPQEIVVIVPDEEINKILGLSEAQLTEKVPNWQGWLRLFFK